MNQLILCLFFCAFLSGISTAQQGKTTKTAQCSQLQREWMGLSYKITQNTVGFSPPVAARAYAYLHIAVYEAMLPAFEDYLSLSGQLQGFERKTYPEQKNLNYALVCNRTNYRMISYFYRNMPGEYLQKLKSFYEANRKKFAKGSPAKINSASEKYADAIAEEIINWSKTDGADEAFKTNFPQSYIPPKGDSCWVQTFPGYFRAMQPFWGKNRLLLKSNAEQSADIPYFGFSTDTNSILYKDALEIYRMKIDTEKEIIAEYWDDAPGYSGTPSGHFFSIAAQLSDEKNMELAEMLSMNACLGIAINDAMIETWRLKYRYNLLRPITYIERHIGKGFNTAIATPPFPEFPSGHSYQSGAGTEVLKQFLGDSCKLNDKTQAERLDIIGKPRFFDSFTQMSEEISISRLYGGIHYRTTLSISLAFGRKIGINTAKSLKFKS